MVFDLLQGRRLVFYFGVDLTRADVRVDGGEEPGDGLCLAADELGYGQHGDNARVGEVVVPEVEVGRVLPTEGRVMLSHLRLDDGVARLGPYGLPALALDELGERFRADRAVEYGRPRLLLQHVLRYEGGREVARDRRALFIDNEAAVVGSVEGHPEVGALFDHALLKLLDVLGFDGVRWMVGEGAVELEVHRYVLEREVLEDRWDHFACHAVSRVDHDLQRPQVLRLYEAQAVFGIVYGDVGLLHRTRMFRGVGELPGDDEVGDLPETRVSREGDCFLSAELEAVVIFGVVRGCYHGPAGLLEVPYGEVERIGRDQPKVEDVCSRLGNPLYKGLLQDLARDAHVAGHDDPGAREVQVLYEGTADVSCHALIQALGINAADVVGFEYRLVQHLLPPDSSRSVCDLWFLASGTITGYGPSCRPVYSVPGLGARWAPASSGSQPCSTVPSLSSPPCGAASGASTCGFSARVQVQACYWVSLRPPAQSPWVFLPTGFYPPCVRSPTNSPRAWSTAPLRPAWCSSRSSPGWLRKRFSGGRFSRSSAWWSPLCCSAWPILAPTGVISYGRRGPYWSASFSVFSTRSAAVCSPPCSPTPHTTPRRSCSGNAPARTRRRPASSEQAPQHHDRQDRRPFPCWSCAGRSEFHDPVARCSRIPLARGLLAGGGVDLTRGQGHRGEPGGQGVPDLGQAAFRRGARGGLRLSEGRGLRYLRGPRGESRADIEDLRPWPSPRWRRRRACCLE